MNDSLLNWILSQPRETWSQLLSEFTDTELEDLYVEWRFWARPNQLPPPGDEWAKWVLLAGRGFGKTRSGAEWVTAKAKEFPGCRIGLVARTAADARDTMVEGDAGLIAIAKPDFIPIYEPSKRRVTWPNGSQATLFSGEKPDALRGPAHQVLWCDELASWKYPEAFDMAMFGLRLGEHPQVIITTTPRPTKEIKELLVDDAAIVVRGSTYENRDNLAPSFFAQIVRKYEGTRLGRQELNAEILDDNPAALFKRADIDRNRVLKLPREFVRIVVGVDPEAASEEDSAETGIIVCGLGTDGHGYVLDDVTIRGTPLVWAQNVIAAFNRHRANLVVAEVNMGGEMVTFVLQSLDDTLPVKQIHASRGKMIRAEPISLLVEQGRIHHVGAYAELEDQLCEWVPGGEMDSPDRLDAFVHAMTELMIFDEPEEAVVYDDGDQWLAPW